MMKIGKASLPSNDAIRLSTLLGLDFQNGRFEALVQGPSTNSGTLYIGDSSQQVIEIVAGGAVGFNAIQLQDMYVKGTTGDVVNLMGW